MGTDKKEGRVFRLLNLEFRPFRTSAIAFGLMLLGLNWMGLNHDLNLVAAVGEAANVIINAVIDVSVFMVSVTGYVTAITKLADDGGESDTVKVIREFVDYLKTKDA